MTAKKLLTLLLIFGLLACGEDETPGEDLIDGSFNVSVSGGVNLSSTGTAQFLHSKITNPDLGIVGSNIGIILEDDSDSDIITNLTIVIPEDATGVKTGTYPINVESSEGNETVTLVSLLTPSEGLLAGSSGSITLSEINDLQVKGSFSATIGIGDNESSISGEFEATGLTQTLD